MKVPFWAFLKKWEKYFRKLETILMNLGES
jgi:hypothetical protein